MPFPHVALLHSFQPLVHLYPAACCTRMHVQRRWSGRDAWWWRAPVPSAASAAHGSRCCGCACACLGVRAQVLEWMGCVVVARTVVGCCVVILIPVLRNVSSFMDRQFGARPDAYLLTVMVCIPLIVNVGLAYIQDQVGARAGAPTGVRAQAVSGLIASVPPAVYPGSEGREGRYAGRPSGRVGHWGVRAGGCMRACACECVRACSDGG